MPVCGEIVPCCTDVERCFRPVNLIYRLKNGIQGGFYHGISAHHKNRRGMSQIQTHFGTVEQF
jgi:hypothetical protein